MFKFFKPQLLIVLFIGLYRFKPVLADLLFSFYYFSVDKRNCFKSVSYKITYVKSELEDSS